HNFPLRFAAYQSLSPNWPMDTSRALPRVAFNNVRNYSYDTTKEDFYLIVEQLFVNTDGFAVALDSRAPLFMRRDPNHGDPLLCFSTNNSKPYDSKVTDPHYTDLM